MTDIITTTPLREAIKTALDEAEAKDPSSMEAETLRLVTCAINDRDICARSNPSASTCDDATIRELLVILIRQRDVSAREYEESGKFDLAEREREERNLIARFLPKPLAGEALETAVEAVVDDLDATGLKDVGKCMSELKQRYPDRIDIGSAGKVMKKTLG